MRFNLGMGSNGVPGTPSIQVVFCTDKNYLPHAATALVSLLENEPMVGRVFLVSHDISTGDVNELINLVKDRYRVKLEFLSVTSSFLRNVHTSGHVSEAAYLRFLLPEILPKDVDSVLYLDSDLVVIDRISDLLPRAVFEADKTERVPLLWAVSEGHPTHLREKGFQLTRYFNSGVMVINLLRWREELPSSELFEKEGQLRGQLRWWDQDVLNIVVQDDWADLPPELNGVSGNRSQSTRVIHFNSHRKPWKLGASDEDRKLYLRFRNLTPFLPFKPTIDFVSLAKLALPNRFLMILKSIRGVL